MVGAEFKEFKEFKEAVAIPSGGLAG